MYTEHVTCKYVNCPLVTMTPPYSTPCIQQISTKQKLQIKGIILVLFRK